MDTLRALAGAASDAVYSLPSPSVAVQRDIPQAIERNLPSIAELILGMMPGSGDVMAARDATDYSGRTVQSAREGRYGDAAGNAALTALLAAGALPLVPGFGGVVKGTGNLPMDDASRVARSKEQGYSGGFYRGEASGKLPDEYAGGHDFSRDPETAAGFAKRGGQDAPREFMLRFSRPLLTKGSVTLGDWADIVRAADDGAKQRIVDAAPIGGEWTVERFLRAADANRKVDVGSGSLLWAALDNGTGDAFGTLRRAGFDAIDSGRDVRMLTGQGIREKSAAFDPAKVESRNIFASLAALLGLGGAAAASSNPD
jgi:hypothetical protein